jgi:hypothetical protein
VVFDHCDRYSDGNSSRTGVVIMFKVGVASAVSIGFIFSTLYDVEVGVSFWWGVLYAWPCITWGTTLTKKAGNQI